MTVWPITRTHADLIATAYVDFVDASADPQDIGMAALADSLQGAQTTAGRKMPREWQEIEAYVYVPSSRPVDREAVGLAVESVADTGRAWRGWAASDTRTRLMALQRALEGMASA